MQSSSIAAASRIASLIFLFSCMLFVLPAQPVLAADGDLDPAFGSWGIVTASLDDEINGSALVFQPDGKLVVAGYYWNNLASAYELVVARFCQDGLLDEGSNCGAGGFGGDGLATAPIGDAGWQVETRAALFLADGKILVGGYATFGAQSDFFLARFNPDGSLDLAFDGEIGPEDGGDGILHTELDGDSGPSGNSGDYLMNLALQPDGKVVASGYSSYGHNDIAVARYNSDGTLDPAFDGDGIFIADLGYTSTSSALAIQPDGKLLVGGYRSGGQDALLLLRLCADGQLDNGSHCGASGFDGAGIYTLDLSPNNDGVIALALQADGKILAAGYQNSTSPHSDFLLMRFNSDGSLDETFDGDSGTGNGLVVTPIGDENDLGSEVMLQSDGKILVVGRSDNRAGEDYDEDVAVVRYLGDGRLDTSFSGDGKLTRNIDKNDTPGGAVLTPDGKLVVAGSSGEWSEIDWLPYFNMSVLRFQTGSAAVAGTAKVETATRVAVGSTNVWAHFEPGHACTRGLITAVKHLDYPGETAEAGEMPMFWDIATDCSSEYSLELSLCYTDDELDESGITDESNLAAYQYVDDGWEAQGGAVDEALNCVRRSAVSSLSFWTVGDPTAESGPTAVRIRAFRGRSAPASSRVWLAAGLLGPLILFTSFRRYRRSGA